MKQSIRLVVLLVFCCPQIRAEPSLHSPQELREDLDALLDFVDRTHPDIRHSADPRALDRAVKEVRAHLDRPMTQVQAWRQLSKLNPQFADGHLFIGLPDWRADAKRHLQRGGTLFPYEVHVDARGDVFVQTMLGGGPTALAGARIESIDGVAARRIARQLLAHVHGDTPAFRAHLLSQRWWLYYWKVFGERDSYTLRIAGARQVVAGSKRLPAMIASEDSFDRQFGLELLDNEAAVLNLDSFAWPDKAGFREFTRKSFEQLRDSRVPTLIIDIRNNGGGDDDLWIEGIMPYIATRPYRTGSSYRVRIIEGRAAPGEKVGDVRSGEQGTWIQPEPENPLRFAGRVYVLVGPGTYSSAVLFSNVMQDFGFGTVVGEGGAVRSSQSGGVQSKSLPHTGLIVYSPRFVLTRPAGAEGWVQPSIAIPDDPARPRASVEAVLGR
ncbi:MAG: S41 family peptidase [Lysobacterales bacterium]